MTIIVPPKETADYIAATGAVAVVIVANPANGTHTFKLARDLGRIGVAHSELAAAYWLADARAARMILRDCRDRAHGTTELPVACSAIINAATIRGLTATPHDIVVARATRATQRMNARLHAAMADLRAFHQEYKRRREFAIASGKTFMNFPIAKEKLRRVLIRRLSQAGGGMLRTSRLFDEVFASTDMEGQRESHQAGRH